MSVYNYGREDKKCDGDLPLNENQRENSQCGGRNPLVGIDRDILLTAAVLLLMAKNGSDMRLILALGYILLPQTNPFNQ